MSLSMKRATVPAATAGALPGAAAARWRLPAAAPPRHAGQPRRGRRMLPPPKAIKGGDRADLSAAKPPVVPPGDLPFVGHLFRIDLQRIYKSVEEMFQSTGAQALEVHLLGSKFVHTRHPEDCSQIYGDQELFRKTDFANVTKDWLGNGLATQRDIPKHAKMRRLLNPAFRTEYVQGLSPTFAEVGDKLADGILQLGEHDMQDMAMRATIDVIGLTGFRYDFGCLDIATGKRSSPVTVTTGKNETLDVAKLFEQLTKGAGNLFAYARLFPSREWVPGYKDYREAITKLDDVIDTVLLARRKEGVKPGDLDLISFCVRALEEDSTLMDDAQIRDELHTMLFAGSDTTANTLSWMFYYLTLNPEKMSRCLQEVDALAAKGVPVSPSVLNEELPFLTACFKEALRLVPPATAVIRVCEEDIVLRGSRTLVPSGTLVLTNIFSTQRNPNYWKRSEEFCPERWLPEGLAAFGPLPQEAFIPFGGGARICIGQHFAVLEGQILACRVFQKAQFEPVPGFEPQLISQVTLASSNGMRLRAVPRKKDARGTVSVQEPVATA